MKNDILKKMVPFTVAAGLSASMIISNVLTAKKTLKIQSEIKDKDMDDDDILKLKLRHYSPVIALNIVITGILFTLAVRDIKLQASLLTATACLKNKSEKLKKIETIYFNDGELDLKDSEDEIEVYDSYLNRYLKLSPSQIIIAETLSNLKLRREGILSVADFYYYLGVDDDILKHSHHAIDDNEGWSRIICDWFEVSHKIAVQDDGLEILCLEFTIQPSTDYLYSID